MTKQLNQSTEDQKNVYVDVYRILIVGMVISTVFFVVGLALAVIHTQFFPLSASWVRQQYHWPVIRHGLAHGDPTTYLLIATVLLILTPVVRVIVSIYAFFVDEDHKYVIVTSTVFAIMVLTVVLGLFGLQ